MAKKKTSTKSTKNKKSKSPSAKTKKTSRSKVKKTISASKRKSLASNQVKKNTAKKSRPKEEEMLFDLGKLSFILGVFLVIVIGLIVGLTDPKLTVALGFIYSIIFILGIIVGLLNIRLAEVNEFLIASITFIVASGLNIYIIKTTLPVFGALIEQIFLAIGVFVAPAAVIVALKSIYTIARKR